MDPLDDVPSLRIESVEMQVICRAISGVQPVHLHLEVSPLHPGTDTPVPALGVIRAQFAKLVTGGTGLFVKFMSKNLGQRSAGQMNPRMDLDDDLARWRNA